MSCMLWYLQTGHWLISARKIPLLVAGLGEGLFSFIILVVYAWHNGGLLLDTVRIENK